MSKAKSIKNKVTKSIDEAATKPRSKSIKEKDEKSDLEKGT